MAEEGFSSIVLEWRIEDIQNARKYAKKLKPIPLRFESRKDYCEAFKWLLIDDTRAGVQQILESIGSNAYLPVWASLKQKTDKNDSPLKQLELITEGGKNCVRRNKRDAPWVPRGTDLAVLTTIVPKALEDLQEREVIYFLVKIGFADDDLENPIKAATHDPGETLADLFSLEPERVWYLVYLDTLATRLRTWNALTPDPKKCCPDVAEEILDSGRLGLQKSSQAWREKSRLKNAVEDYCHRQGLNASQREAVVDAIVPTERGTLTDQRVKLMQGPPGTGKTTTTVVLVSIASAFKKRMLVCAPSNRAIAEVAERFLHQLESNMTANSQFSDLIPLAMDETGAETGGEIRSCKPLQLGDVVLRGSEDRLDTEGALRKIFLRKRVDRLRMALSPTSGWNPSVKAFTEFLKDGLEEFRTLERTFEKEKEEQEKKEEKENNMEFKKEAESKERLDFLQFARQKLVPSGTNIIKWGNTLCEDMPTKALGVAERLSMKETCSLVAKLLGYLAANSLSTADLEKCFEADGAMASDGSLCASPGRRLSSCAGDFCALRRRILERNVGEKFASVKKLSKRSNRHLLEECCLKQAVVVFCTVSGAGSEAVKRSKGFEYVVVDEAAQVTEAETAIVSQMPGVKGLLLVGDPKQLQAVVHSKRAKTYGFARSLFERLQETGHLHHMLKEQRRMHPDISHFPSHRFYNGVVRDGPNVTQKTYGLKLQDCPYGAYAFVDVPDSLEQTHKTIPSWKNPVEAEVVLRLVSNVRAGTCKDLNVGVITPYRGQAALLQEKMSELCRTGAAAALGPGTSSNWKKSKAFDIVVKTVDGFQGGERGVIIFSAVRSNESGTIGFLDDARRLNVALTRGRYCVWVVGNATTLQKKNKLWRALIKDAKDRQCFWTYTDSNGVGHETEETVTQMRDQPAKVSHPGRCLGTNTEGKNQEKKKSITAQTNKPVSEEISLPLTNDVIDFKEAVWQVNFTDHFKNSVAKIESTKKRKTVVETILDIEKGCPELHKPRCALARPGYRRLVHVRPAGGRIVVWTTNVERGDPEMKQIVIVWDLVDTSELVPLIRRLEAGFSVFSKAYLERCEERRFSGRSNEVVVPAVWKFDSSFVWLSSETSEFAHEVTAAIRDLSAKFHSLTSKTAQQLMIDNVESMATANSTTEDGSRIS